ncbi:MAG: DMT family transporter [Pseudomonadota bacterium]
MSRTFAVGLVLFAAILMSFIGLTLRLIEQADGFQILVYRSLSLSLVVLLLACLRRKAGPIDIIRSLDRLDLLIGLLLSFIFTSYVLALLNTSIASALFLLSSAPIFAAGLAWIFIGERPTQVTWIALSMAIAGVLIMVQDGFSTGGTLGNVFAILSAFCFASLLVVIRWTGREDTLGGIFLGGIFATILNIAILLFIGKGIVLTQWDLIISLFMGAILTGLGVACVTWAASRLPSSEVSTLILLESVLGPIWVWIFLGEKTTSSVLFGGAIVLGAVTMLTLSRGDVSFDKTPVEKIGRD